MLIAAEIRISDICSKIGELFYGSSTKTSVFNKTFSEGFDLIIDKILLS